MAQYSFQEQLLSVMEVVASAATEEIQRRVADSCAVIRIELSRSQRDIEHLKKKCFLMENELRKVRGRGRRKVFICSTSPKISLQNICNQETNACRADRTVSPTGDCPELSTPNVHQGFQAVEDQSAAIVKVEGTESEQQWNNATAGPFAFEHLTNESHDLAQEAAEGQNRFPEDMEGQRTHFIDISSPAKSSEEGSNRLNLQVKTEEEEKEVPEVILVEASEQRSEPADQLSCDLPVFTQPLELGIEQSEDDTIPVENNQSELYSARQVIQDPPQPAWCRDRTHEPDHVIQRERSDASITQQQQQQQSRTAAGAGMASHPGPYLGRGRGGHRRFRPQRITNVDGERRFSCSYCVRTFLRFSQLKEHLRSHTGERPYSCTQCGRSFTKQGNLIRHAVVHSGEKPYQCNLCGKCFTQRSSLKSHQKTHTFDRDGVLHGFAPHQSGQEPIDSMALTQSRAFL